MIPTCQAETVLEIDIWLLKMGAHEKTSVKHR